ncbi:peptidylprolyl isomerase [Vibrio mexicanus]|uniref:peptidylprolyl isomerase n=1 Tax=Vibrio mexicanus TaxID=1004326 RepID=UPI00063C59D7|nr:peptidylprolyl isomerase [Vibrio mexicanus]
MLRAFIASLALVSCSLLAAPKVLVETNLGPFEIELYEKKAPISVENFLRYVEDGSYEGSIFHRVIPNFMAQGGGFDKDFKRLETYAPIKNEADNNVANNTATVAMARTNDPNSATRQFFINFKDNHFLNKSRSSDGYAVFGRVTKGFEVVQGMAKKPTRSVGRMQDVPVDPIVITNISVIE